MAGKLRGYCREGSFYIPRGTALADLGGKASRLIETEDVVRAHGFEMPTAVALPWQTFAATAERSGNIPGWIDRDYPESRGPRMCGRGITFNDFDTRGLNALADCMRTFELPFFSSSAPGEDSMASRMAGVYDSNKPTFYNDKDTRGHFKNTASAAGTVIQSYFDMLGTLLRNKHQIPHLGMGILARETLGGKTGPAASMVFQMLTPTLAGVALGEGFGDGILSEMKGFHFQYDFTTGKLLERRGGSSVVFSELPEAVMEMLQDMYAARLPGGFDGFIPLIHRLRELDAALAHPPGFGGDYEISFLDGRAYMLQAPSIRHMEDVAVPKNGNLLYGHLGVAGCGVSEFSRIVFTPRIFGWNVGQSEAQDLLSFNRENADYVIVTQGLPYDVVGFCNAAGIIDMNRSLGSGMVHYTKVVDHYTTLLRSEHIGVVDSGKLDGLAELEETASEVGSIKVLEAAGELRYNQFRQEAGLYLR